jgi:hypothetical protein
MNFTQRNHIPHQEGEFDEIEAVLYYESSCPIYVIKDGERWEYDSMQATNKKYGCFLFNEEIYENNDLEKVQGKLFRNYVKNWIRAPYAGPQGCR